MRRPISVKREHPAEPMILDVLTATETNSKSITSLEYFRLFNYSTAHDAEPGFRMVEYRLLAENESVKASGVK